MNNAEQQKLSTERKRLQRFLLIPIVIVGAVFLVHDNVCVAGVSMLHDLIQQGEARGSLVCMQMDYPVDVTHEINVPAVQSGFFTVKLTTKNNRPCGEEHSLYSALSPPSELKRISDIFKPESSCLLPFYYYLYPSDNSGKSQQSMSAPYTDWHYVLDDSKYFHSTRNITASNVISQYKFFNEMNR